MKKVILAAMALTFFAHLSAMEKLKKFVGNDGKIEIIVAERGYLPGHRFLAHTNTKETYKLEEKNISETDQPKIKEIFELPENNEYPSIKKILRAALNKKFGKDRHQKTRFEIHSDLVKIDP